MHLLRMTRIVFSWLVFDLGTADFGTRPGPWRNRRDDGEAALQVSGARR
jgi:hypothetical protein